MDLLAVYALRMSSARAVTLVNVLIKNGVKIVLVPSTNCFLCEIDCKKGLLAKLKPYGFTIFAKRYGLETLLDCLERNEKNGVVYHREGIYGDYDGFTDLEELIAFIKNAPDLLVR